MTKPATTIPAIEKQSSFASRYSHQLPLKGKTINEIAVIGTGISGLGALLGIAEELEENAARKMPSSNLSVHIFEKERIMGQGFPYSSEHMEPEHFVNMPLDGMSLYPEDLNNWLKDNDGRVKGVIADIFLSRFKKEFLRIFGEDFQDELVDEYKMRFGEDFLVMNQKYKDAYSAFEARYLRISDPQFYPTRIAYGLYLQDRLQEVKARLTKLGIKIILHPNTEVTDIDRDSENNIMLTYKNDTGVNKVVLGAAVIATGHWKSKDTHTAENYFSSVWPAKDFRSRLEEVIKHAATKKMGFASFPVTVKIAVQGSSLSSVDALKIIFQNGKYIRDTSDRLVFIPPLYTVKDANGNLVTARIEVDILSRNGMLPKVRGPYGDYKNKYLNEKNVHELIAKNGGYILLKQVMQLLSDDIRCAYAEAGVVTDINWEKLLSPSKRGFEQLQKDLEKSIKGDGSNGALVWQTVYHQASDLFLQIHKHLPPEDKLRYEVFLRTVHFMHIAPMSQYTAEELLAMKSAGVLEVRSLGQNPKHHIRGTDGNIEFTDREGQTHLYDATVVATGQDTKVNRNPTMLFRNMLQRGMVATSQDVIPDTARTQDFSTNNALQQYTRRNSMGDHIYDTGELRRSKDMELIDHHNKVQNGLYVVGVASSAFGISRASRSVLEGRVVGRNVVRNFASLSEEVEKKWTERCNTLSSQTRAKL